MPVPWPELGKTLMALPPLSAKMVEAAVDRQEVQAGSARRGEAVRQRRRAAPTRRAGERVMCDVPFLCVWVLARPDSGDESNQHRSTGKRTSGPAKCGSRPALPGAEG